MIAESFSRRALRRGGEEAKSRTHREGSRSFAVAEGRTQMRALCSSISVQESTLHNHFCPFWAKVHWMGDLEPVPPCPQGAWDSLYGEGRGQLGRSLLIRFQEFSSLFGNYLGSFLKI